MTLTLVRRWATTVSTIGALTLDGRPCGFTLEPPLSGPPPRAIPEGTYRVELRWSPHFGAFLPGLVDVPGRSDILIHVGNSLVDTEGCILVGTTRATNWIGESGAAWEAVMAQVRFPLGLTIQTSLEA